ncbi:neuronal calcium sensor 1-like isoform X2 [Symsagittifera roscoffensis]|uniref:neuronal calcium sensor 1-like isoform X2 n=1 Tax=Symsagittifera roscoffensis TaxID=84072 RepID=UPI00307C26D9
MVSNKLSSQTSERVASGKGSRKNTHKKGSMNQIRAMKTSASGPPKELTNVKKHSSETPKCPKKSKLGDDDVFDDISGDEDEPGTNLRKTTNYPSLRNSPMDFARFWFNKLISAGYDQSSSSTFKLCEEFDELEMQFTRSRPPSLSHLLKKHPEFTRDEMKTLYRGFKQSCSNGVLTEEALQEIFGQIFQIGDSAEFSQLVFATLDHDNDGEVIFEEFIHVLSVLTRRGAEEKLEWIFKLYDIDQDGTINEQELLLVLRALYSMSSSSRTTEALDTENLIADHLGHLYRKFIMASETKREGFVTLRGFKDICLRDESIMQQISVLTVVV